MEKKKNNPLIHILLFRNIVGGLFGSLTHVLILSIAESFGLSTSELGGLLSANYVASIVMPLLAGRLGDLFGKKRVVIAAMIVSIMGSILVIVSPTAEIYVIGIIIGGLGGSAENSVLTHTSDSAVQKAMHKGKSIPRRQSLRSALPGCGFCAGRFSRELSAEVLFPFRSLPSAVSDASVLTVLCIQDRYSDVPRSIHCLPWMSVLPHKEAADL